MKTKLEENVELFKKWVNEYSYALKITLSFASNSRIITYILSGLDSLCFIDLDPSKLTWKELDYDLIEDFED